jgi:BirA family biotin operon repressor/biotin-[acetyl-CoA-carboxylase] ligase
MQKIIEKPVTGSTSSDAKELAEAGAGHMTIVWAHRQTAGRGRHDRKWISYEGNVFWSAILRPDHRWPRFTDIVFVNALAVHRTISEVTGKQAALQLKWPNDVLLNGKKVSGSLLESGGGFTGRNPRWIVIGVGINVVAHPEGADMRYPPTSLHAEGFSVAMRDHLVAALSSNLESEIEWWLGNGFGGVQERYLQHAHGLNQAIRIGLTPHKDEYIDGVYRGIDADGALLLQLADGKKQRFDAGDVILKPN